MKRLEDELLRYHGVLVACRVVRGSRGDPLCACGLRFHYARHHPLVSAADAPPGASGRGGVSTIKFAFIFGWWPGIEMDIV